MSSIPAGHHQAAILASAESLGRLEITHRPTPTPGPNEILIEVHSIALNLVDCYQRNLGIMISKYPTVLGSDVSGTVISTGSSVSTFNPGDRVVGFASGYFHDSDPNYGAFQRNVVVSAEKVFALPEGVSFSEGTLLPMGVSTAWSGFYGIGIGFDTKHAAEDKKGVIVWGGASSIGSAALQVAKALGFVVYTTASPTHHEYMKTLGASRVFNYKDGDVVDQITKAAKEDGITMDVGYDAVPGALQQCVDVLRNLKGEGKARLASAPLIPENFPKSDDVEVKFAITPQDAKDKREFFERVFGVWLKDALARGAYVPSPKIKVIPGGFEGLNSGMDELMKGVSGVKIVLEI